jgi:TolB-like protein/class 3 adenylate cyclase/Tfp pilus assembly protein PilF
MSVELKPAGQGGDLQLEIAHLLLIDVVGYSKLLVNEQVELLQELSQLVRSTECFQAAEKKGKLIRLPTGDGMALLFFRSPEEPVQCALQIGQALKDHPNIQLRMGIHSGPVNEVPDVNDRLNIAGAGINIAQRVMDCGDAGHILLSKHVADDLAQYRHWKPHLQDLGECEVKHGLRLHIVNLCKEGVGNPALPEKLRRGKRWKQTTSATVRPVRASDWPKWALVVALLLSVAALVIGLSIILHRGSPKITRVPAEESMAASIPEKSIAVMPFENLSADQENAFFADGVQDEILTDLAKIADLKVISRTSVMPYKTGAKRNLREIAKALSVAHVVEGSVQRTGNRVRVSAQLIDARTDMHLWAERYDRDLADVFAIQSEIAKAIADQLQAKISPSERAEIEKAPTTNLAAFDLYERAKALWADVTDSLHARETLPEAARLLDEAVARDPHFLLGWCLLSRVHDAFYWYGFDHSSARLDLANVAVQTALRLQPDAGEAHLALANYYYFGFLDYGRARSELAIARKTLPNNAEVFVYTGFIDRREGHWEEATRNIERALELDPRNLFILQQLASYTYRPQRRYADAARIFDRALTIVPGDPLTRINRAEVALDWRADIKPYQTTLATLIAENPSVAPDVDHPDYALCERTAAGAARVLAHYPREGVGTDYGVNCPYAYWEGVVARWQGDPAKARTAFTAARREVEKTLEKQPSYTAALSLLGVIDAGLGRKEEALREGRRACELLPISKDAIAGAAFAVNLAQIYAWTGEKDLAIEQIAAVERAPNGLSYGFLKLHPYWDSLRGDPRFGKIVASLAPE